MDCTTCHNLRWVEYFAHDELRGIGSFERMPCPTCTTSRKVGVVAALDRALKEMGKMWKKKKK